jgi:hypothetical protein
MTLTELEHIKEALDTVFVELSTLEKEEDWYLFDSADLVQSARSIVYTYLDAEQVPSLEELTDERD